MKLREFLEAHKGEMVKVGSASSYVWCGKVDDETNAFLLKASDKEHKRIKKVYPMLLSKDKTFDEEWDRRYSNKLKSFETMALGAGFVPKVRKEKKEKMIADFNFERQKAREALTNLLIELPERITNWTTFLEREVVDIYPSLEGGTIVIFDGKESGKYWLYSECEKEETK